MHLARTRSLFFLAFLACALIVGVAVYLQHYLGSFPCPLCQAQRVLLSICSAACLIAALHAPGNTGWRVYSGLILAVSLTGAAVAARQVWLQGAPAENLDACAQNLLFLLDTQPWLKVFSLVIAGNAGCSEINWSLFGISLPEWSLLAFSGMTLFALYYLFVEFRRPKPMNTGNAD
ncbi:disulfide bond formation protein B [Pseudomonas sp. GD03842]|uniref:disulfide bond formation protein B n=1 Tax=unclassified Pseudomonas TaxID=196821 RepID=UPI000D338836|nr:MULTISPECIES: disulfide bond formation protein B [unclassified Pseudomonas]MDH0745886.1 disulfide bond formation protein B [Pseudomonas sp. GD03842]RAU48683.1 disulfide bond formation protein B [Pseudomonas sp. RIT 409]RAU54057.1 disulfide bond formation protein B [Pseudomonas sp. RIT 412]